MSDTTRVDFDKPQSKAERRDERNQQRGKEPPAKKPGLKERIAVLPEGPRIDPSTIGHGDQRAVAAANMRLAGAPFHEIAKELGYQSAEQARSAYIGALASMNPMEDLETLRQAAALRADMLFRQSLALATATHLVDRESGVEVPNTDRLRWHEQAAKDLLLHATITGAKAPARLEVSASTSELNQMVHVLVQANGAGAADIEADVWEIDEIEAIDAEVVED